MSRYSITRFIPKKAKFIKVFYNYGGDYRDFSAMYKAEEWLQNNGFSCGSTNGSPYVAIRNGKYDLPQKLHNFIKEDFEKMDGVIYSHDYRNGDVEIRLYEDFKEVIEWNTMK